MSEVVRRLTEDVANIQKLGDNPRTDNGMDAAELKAWFDKAPEAIKAFLNESMIPDLEKKFKSQDEWADGVEEAINKFVQGEGFLPSDGSMPMTGDLNMGNHRVVGVANPTEASHATNKKYVDSVKETANTALTKANAAEPALGFTPVQQGFLDGTGTNKLRFGWRSLPNGRGTLGVFVDGTDIGNIPMSNPFFGGCTPFENGGTGATTRIDALKNLNGTGGLPQHMPLNYPYPYDTGLVAGPVSTASFMELMDNNSTMIFTQNKDTATYLDDLPADYGVVTLNKGVNNDFRTGFAIDIINHDMYVYDWWHSWNTGESGWKRVLTNVLSSKDYGTAFPANAVTGQVYYIKG